MAERLELLARHADGPPLVLHASVSEVRVRASSLELRPPSHLAKVSQGFLMTLQPPRGESGAQLGARETIRPLILRNVRPRLHQQANRLGRGIQPHFVVAGAVGSNRTIQ